MKDVLCLAALAGKILCLMVFVAVLRPDKIGAVEAPVTPAYCKTVASGMQGCDPRVRDQIMALKKWW